MKKNPILVFTGLAVAAVAGVVGLTTDRWMPPAAVEVSTGDASQATPATSEQQQSAPATSAAPETAPATAEPPAAGQAAAPAAEESVPAAQATAPATDGPAATEQQTAAASEAPAAGQASAPKAEAAASEQAAEAPAATETQDAAAPATGQPAAPVSQQAAAPATEQPAIEEAAAKPDAPADDTVPTFDTVRVEKSGEAVIAGQAEAGAEVAVKLDGKTIGTATANSDGSFVVVPEEPLPAGSGALTIESKADAGAPATQSEQTVAIIVPEQGKDDALVAVMSPDAPTKVLQKPEPEPEPQAADEAEVAVATPTEESAAGEAPAPAAKPRMISLDAVDYDAEGNIVFSGKGTPGHVARIYVDNALTGEAVIGADGRWTFSGTTAVAPGVHALRVDGVDSAGKVASRIEVPFFREETTKVATATPDQVVPKSGAGAVEPDDAASDATAAVEASTAAEKSAKATEGRLVIQPGNNLWRISKVIYGDGLKYATLYQANKDQIRDPDLIYPGQVFRTPDVLPPETIDPAQRDPMTATESSAVVQ